MRYPVPPDGEVLASADLKALAWFGLERAGLGLRGQWGFFSPPGKAAANFFRQEDNQVKVRRLAIISPEGLVLVASNATVPLAEGPFFASWRIPKDRNDTETSDDATLQPGDPSYTYEANAQVPIGRIERHEDKWQIRLDTPALSLDALESLAEAWSNVCNTVSELAERFIGSQAGQGLVGTLIAEAAMELSGFDQGNHPKAGTRLLNRVVFRMHESVRQANTDERVLEQAREFLDSVKEADRCASGGVSALVDALVRVTSKGRDINHLRDWLRPRGTPLPCRERRERAGELDERHFTLEGEPGGAIAIRIESRTPEPPLLWYALDKQRPQEASLAETRKGFESKISEAKRGAARELTVLCGRNLDVTVCVL